MKKITLSLSIICYLFTHVQAQKSEKLPRYFAQPIMTDSSTTLFFPTLYNEELLSTNKIALGGDYYANILVYDFVQDTYRKLFKMDTYIKSLQNPYCFGEQTDTKLKNTTAKWMFLFVKSKDYNGSGRIDEKDPTSLFVTTSSGNDLKLLTVDSENVVSLNIFEKQGFGLIKIQRDENQDKSFTNADADYYYRKINLTDLSLGKPIEVK